VGEAAAAGLLLLVLAGVLAHAVGGGAASTAAPAMPSCVDASKRVAVPPGWNVPLPPGAVVTGVQSTAIRQVSALVPAAFADTVRWYREDFPRLGYELGSGDAENDEAEADFSGHGIRGRFRVNGIVGCSGATALAVAAA
jgi:hypothetical protein